MQSNNTAVARLKAVVEADPGALVRVLQFFQARNVIPLRVDSRRMGLDFLEIEVHLDLTELSSDAVRIVVSKINELPIVIAVVTCD
jgi:prephenate dehydratase